jgi:hypothetical protein
MFRKHATYRWKVLDKDYNFALDVITIRDLHAKLWAPKITGISDVRISGLSNGSPGTKNHLDVAPAERCKIYYKGGRWWLPPSLGCPVTHPNTKSVTIMH